MRASHHPFRSLPLALAGAFALAALSLLAPWGPIYDSWSWLVWGRELGAFDLDTSAGPSWKPLPALVAAPLSLAGGAAPELWLLVARTGWIMAAAMTWRLAARFAGGGRAGHAAGLIAAIGLVLLADDFTSWTRQGTGGLTEPLLVALALGSVEAALFRRTRLALGLAALACLIRPEAWPFAAAYAWHEWRRGAALTPALLAGAIAIAALWIVPDLIAAGDALEGSARARGGVDPANALDVLGRALELPPAALWVGAALALARSQPGSAERVLGAGALAWIALVAVMAATGFAGLPRFMAPAAALVCALGAAGFVRAARPADSPAARAIAVVAIAGFALQGAFRATDVAGELDRAAADERSIAPLLAAADSRPEAFACAPLSAADFRAQPPLAWELEIALGDVIPTSSAFTPRGTLVLGPRTRSELRALAIEQGDQLVDTGDWGVLRLGDCAGARR